MFRQAENRPEQPDRPEAALPSARTGRNFTPVPLGIVGGFMALAAEFFGLFLLAWGMAPTSIGCGAGRAFSMTAAMIPIALLIFIGFTWAGLGMMREARQSQLRKRSFLVTFGAIYLIGSIPLFVAAGLFGSCFDL